jgi:hypothetical protein
MRTSARAVIAAASAFAFVACGNDQASQDAVAALTQLSKAATDMAQQAAGGAAGLTGGKNVKPVPPVSFKKLIDYLPKSVEGMKASEPEGETTSALGGQWQYSEAKVSYVGQSGQGAEVDIFDYAHIPVMYASFKALTRINVNSESTKGYQRTVLMDGYTAYEEWNSDSKRSEMTVLVGDRFVVHTQVNGGEAGAAKQLLERIDLKRLARETVR